MSAGTLFPTLPPVVPPVPVRRFTVDEYHQMIQAGILGEERKGHPLSGARETWLAPDVIGAWGVRRGAWGVRREAWGTTSLFRIH